MQRFAVALLASSIVASPAAAALAQEGKPIKAQESCLTCHFGIEDMHPWEEMTCTACHGGDGKAETKERAHVRPRRPPPNDERILPLEPEDPDYLRFVNPTNLRVVDKTCGTCHKGLCEDLRLSLHGTTAGHLSDGMYEAGLLQARGSRFAMFATDKKKDQDSALGLERLLALPSFDSKKPKERFETHYLDLAPKNCVRCHLWAPGVAVRGRLGLDGDYRSEGCAACHVVYADDGLSKSGDPTIDKFEPGHGLTHRLTAAIPTSNCTHCHYGDASIGTNFRGLAQLYPGQPAGPEVPGTTDAQLNRTFYQDDPALVPPDVHHEKGMHCIDCHTLSDVMGDGVLHGQMPSAVEIECSDCHGTFTAVTKAKTSRGRPLENLVEEGGRWFLISKVTGQKHPVRQASHVVNPRHPDYNPRAFAAMTGEHARLECYSCHAGWTPNFFGFHFERREQFTQLDLMTGERTPGRVNTQEKVFATLRGHYLGWNNDGMVAPYLVGFSSMGSASGPDGEMLLDQVMPVTAAGQSGMTLIHHQMHTTRRKARSCADCHRNPTALGLGSPNSSFALARDFFFVASTRGLDAFGIDRKRPGDSTPVANVPELGACDVALVCEPLQGHARVAYVAAEGRGVAVIELANPGLPRKRTFLATDDARGVCAAGDKLYVADGKSGVGIYDAVDPFAPKLLGRVATKDARDLAIHWPFLFVADFEDGLVVVDVTNPQAPRVEATLDLVPDTETDRGIALALLDLPSRPEDGRGVGERSHMRVLAGVACDENGFRVADVTEPRKPVRLEGFSFLGGRVGPRRGNRVMGVAASQHVDLGSPDGAIPTAENDYFYATVAVDGRQQGRLVVVRATDPLSAKAVGTARLSPNARGVTLMHLYNPPFLQTFALVASGDLLEIIDVSKSDQPQGVGQFGGLRGAAAVAVERFALDALVDESGTPRKDVSHEGARFFTRQEIDKILRTPVEVRTAPVGPITGEDRPPPKPR